MQPIKHIFLDDGGVLNDNDRRAPQWQRLVGEFFVPRLGGTHQAWAEANRRTIASNLERMSRRLEDWQPGPIRIATAQLKLSRGDHPIVLEYFRGTRFMHPDPEANAKNQNTLRLSWSTAGLPLRGFTPPIVRN